MHDVFLDSGGNPVIVETDPVEVGQGLTWAMVTKIDLEEALSGDNDFFAKYIENYGYHDLYLINKNGYVFYSVSREADCHTNMADGTYADSPLGELTRRVMATQEFQLADFRPYEPTGNRPAPGRGRGDRRDRGHAAVARGHQHHHAGAGGHGEDRRDLLRSRLR